MNLTLKSASDPVWANAAMTAINVIVEFNEIAGAMPFTASESDTEPHGKNLFDMAAAGDFGVVGSFVAPEPLIPQIVTPRQARLAREAAEKRYMEETGLIYLTPGVNPFPTEPPDGQKK